MEEQEDKTIEKRIFRYLSARGRRGKELRLSKIAGAPELADIGKQRIEKCLTEMLRDGAVSISVLKGENCYKASADPDEKRIARRKRESAESILSVASRFVKGKGYQGKTYVFDLPAAFKCREEGTDAFTAWLPDPKNRDPEHGRIVLSSGKEVPFAYKDLASIHSMERLGLILYEMQEDSAEETARQRRKKGIGEPLLFPIDAVDGIFPCMVIGLGKDDVHCIITVYVGDGQIRQFQIDFHRASGIDEAMLYPYLTFLMQHFHYRKAPVDLYESLLDDEFTKTPITKETAERWSSLLDTRLNELLDVFGTYCEAAAKTLRREGADLKTARARIWLDIVNYARRIEKLYAKTGEFISEVSAKNRGNENLLIPYRRVCALMEQCDNVSVDFGDHLPLTREVSNIAEVKKLWETGMMGVTHDVNE